MLVPPPAGNPRDRVIAWSLSLLAHVIFIGWLLRSPSPTFLTPSFLVKGNNGKSIARLYWPGKDSEMATDAASGTSFNGRNRMAKEHITWNRVKVGKSAARRLDRSNQGPDSKTDIADSTVHPRPAGSPYGSVSDGSLTGPDVRPALPIVSPDPRIEIADLPEGLREGDEIVEITIDAQGNVVKKIVISSLSSVVDAKVLAALENWHFLPATRFGVPIPSKQDVHYHFPQTPRG